MSVLAEAALTRIRNLATTVSEPDTRWQALCREVDPQRVLRNLAHESNLTGADKDASDELDRLRPRNEPNSATIPWETLAYRAQRYAATRADTVGNLTTGGYLVETLNYPSAAQALLSLLILGRLGCTPINSTANLNQPKVSASATASWLTNETTTVPESDQTFGQVALTPHTVGGYTEMSRLLVLQSSPDSANAVANDLVRKIKRVIEAAAFSGSGVAGQPHGLVGLTGTNAVSGTTFALSTVASAVNGIGDALDVDSNPGWATARSVAVLLRQRQEFPASGAVPIWSGPATYGMLADYNAAASSGVPAATAIFGAWRFLTLCDFGGGLQVAVNPYGQSNFQAGIIGIRCFAVVDVGAIWPAAFSIVTGVT